ncbi:hypothetical protein [Actinomadura sp. 9N407]|uniref:hypothetical protein n=1 Tax=Actinomadura sp. 9N407 TaxID=3375154 RepID=UPI003794FF94
MRGAAAALAHFRAIAVVAVVAVAVAGCSGGDPPVPKGFTEFRTDVYAFAHPTGWQRENGEDQRGRPILTFRGPATPGGVDGQVHVGRLDHYGQNLNVQLGQFRGLALMHTYTIKADRAIEMEGAARAHRFEADYELVDGNGSRVPFTLLGMYVLTDDGILLEFMLRSPRRGTAHARLPEIFNSFRLID